MKAGGLSLSGQSAIVSNFLQYMQSFSSLSFFLAASKLWVDKIIIKKIINNFIISLADLMPNISPG